MSGQPLGERRNKCNRASDHRTGHCDNCGQDIDRYDCPGCGLGAEGPHNYDCGSLFG